MYSSEVRAWRVIWASALACWGRQSSFLRRSWSLPITRECGFLESFSLTSCGGFETRSLLVCPLGEHCGWSPDVSLGSGTCWRGILSLAPKSGAWCMDSASFAHSLPSTSWPYCHFYILLLNGAENTQYLHMWHICNTGCNVHCLCLHL